MLGLVNTDPVIFEHDELPTFEECCQLIREEAYILWKNDGSPLTDSDQYWLAAERLLFPMLLESGGYRIYARDRTKPKIDNFYWYYYTMIIPPSGAIELK